MSGNFDDPSIAEITALLGDYFDGLYDGDLEKFARVFHPDSHLYSTDGAAITDMSRAQYFELIGSRDSSRSQGLKRHDRIVSIHKSGPDTAHAVVNCAIPPRYFTDYLTLLKLDGRWQIVAKSFRFKTHGAR